MKNIILSLTLFLIFGCGSSTSINQPIIKPVEKITELTPIEKVKIEKDFFVYDYTDKTPFVITSKINNSNLFLLASSHSNDSQSNTYKTVKYLLDFHPIDMIILEGTPYSVNIENAYANKHECISDPTKCVTEIFYAYSYAKSKDNTIQFSGGEASVLDIYTHVVINKGYSLEDYVGFWYVRNAVYLNGINQMSESALKTRNIDTKQYLENQLERDINFNYNDWTKWYTAHINLQSIDLSTFNQNTLRPLNTNYANIVEKISYEFNIIRDTNLISTINAKVDANFKNILVVYGQGHISTIYRDITNQSNEISYLIRWY